VAVIGTGASAIQFVPEVATEAAHLTVFQRTRRGSTRGRTWTWSPTPSPGSPRPAWSEGGCDSWYLDAEGINRTLWPGFSFEYWARTRRARRGDYQVHGR
jgi:hypothetical protein